MCVWGFISFQVSTKRPCSRCGCSLGISPEWTEWVKWDGSSVQRTFQALFLVTENCSKNTALISVQMLPGHWPVSTAISTSSTFPAASPHLTLEYCNTWIFQSHLAVTSYSCLLKVTAFHLCCPVPKWQWHFTAYLHTRWSRFYPAVAVVALSFFFYSNYSVPYFLAAACTAGIRDPWQLLGPWAWCLMEIESTQLPAVLFDRWQCSAAKKKKKNKKKKKSCKMWDFG